LVYNSNETDACSAVVVIAGMAAAAMLALGSCSAELLATTPELMMRMASTFHHLFFSTCFHSKRRFGDSI